MRIEIKWNSFFEAVRANKISEVEKFLKRNSLYKNDGSEYKDQFGWSPLSLSLELKYKEISLLLVENGGQRLDEGGKDHPKLRQGSEQGRVGEVGERGASAKH